MLSLWMSHTQVQFASSLWLRAARLLHMLVCLSLLRRRCQLLSFDIYLCQKLHWTYFWLLCFPLLHSSTNWAETLVRLFRSIALLSLLDRYSDCFVILKRFWNFAFAYKVGLCSVRATWTEATLMSWRALWFLISLVFTFNWWLIKLWINALTKAESNWWIILI